MDNQYQQVFLITYRVGIEDLAYFAGLFDGEGTVIAGITHRKTRVGLSIGSTNRMVLDWVKQRFGGRIYDTSSKGREHKLWTWLVTGKSSLPLLKAMEPFLKIKGDEVKVAIEMLEYLHPRGGHLVEPDHYFNFLSSKAMEVRKLKSSYKVSNN